MTYSFGQPYLDPQGLWLWAFIGYALVVSALLHIRLTQKRWKYRYALLFPVFTTMGIYHIYTQDFSRIHWSASSQLITLDFPNRQSQQLSAKQIKRVNFGIVGKTGQICFLSIYLAQDRLTSQNTDCHRVKMARDDLQQYLKDQSDAP